MKITNLLLTLLLISSTSFAGETDLWLRFGAGLGYSDWNDQGESHKNSQMYFGGIRPSYSTEKFELSAGLDLIQYNILNDLSSNHPSHREIKHENQNIFLSISPKYVINEKWRLGPYLGTFINDIKVSQNDRIQDVLGIEADYRINEKWMTSLSVEESINDDARHKMAKLSIAFNFGSKKKAAPVMSSAPACQEESHMVYFGFDKDSISASEKEKLMRFMSGKKTVHVRGHADTMGNDDYNYHLSKRRALSVIGLIENHVMSMQVLGEKEPLSLEHKMDRRVEVIKRCE